MGEIRPFLTELLPLFVFEKKCFWPVIPLMFMISEINFTEMFNIEGYIFLLRTGTLAFPILELSAIHRSEKILVPLLYGTSK